jgi:hypothetical protein
MKTLHWVGICLIVLLLSCNSSKITTSWKDESISARKFNKIMVIGIIREADRSIQEKMENHIVSDLTSLGYNAVSALQTYGPNAFKNLDTAAAVIKLKNSGVDAVLTIVLLDKEKERQFVPPTYTVRYGGFWGYREQLYNRIYQPGYYVTNTKYFWESNFYDMDIQKLLYSVQTQSFNPIDAENLGHEYGKIIVKNMEKQHILSQQTLLNK